MSLNGVTTHYVSVGQGTDIVMLHGLGANLAFWYFSHVLTLRRWHRVTAYDLRGHGKSGTTSTGYSTPYLAFDLYALLDHLNIDKAHLVGHSYGGEIALHFAVLYPERVATLTLADVRVRCLQPSRTVADWAAWPNARAMLEAEGIHIDEDDTEVGQLLLQEFARRADRRPAVPGHSSTTFRPFMPFDHPAQRSARQWLKLFDATSLRQDLASAAGLTPERISEISAPVLALYGQWSPCRRSATMLLRSLQNIEVVIIPKGGHFHPVEQPQILASAVREFIASFELEDNIRA